MPRCPSSRHISIGRWGVAIAAALALCFGSGCQQTKGKKAAVRPRIRVMPTMTGIPAPAPKQAKPAEPQRVDSSAVTVRMNTYRPSVHGFKFRNSFSGSPLPVSLGKLDGALGVPQHYGLCGGMSAAAADFFLAGQPMPEQAEPPTKGSDLYSYIYQRQIDSLGPSLTYAGVFAEWMSLPDEGVGGTLARSLPTAGEADTILGRNEPVMLGLVFTSAREHGKLWENHQVLAYDIHAVSTPDQTGYDISIYDPNFPSNDGARIEARYSLEGTLLIAGGNIGCGTRLIPIFGVKCVRTAPGRKATPVRGFFVMPYEYKTPPGKLTEQARRD